MSSNQDEDDDESIQNIISTKKLFGLQTKFKDFDEILLNSSDVDDRTKSLWLEIYANATHDRERAAALITDLIPLLSKNDANAHAIHGQTVVKYLEKMSKANDQLLKIVEQLQLLTKKSDEINYDELLNTIDKKQ